MSNFKFLLLTALRDSRKEIGKIIMFMSSIILGIAALVAINSFNYNLIKDIDRQALSLLGADVSISSNRAVEPGLLAKFDSLPGEGSVQKRLFSMAYIPGQDASQFVEIRAIQGDFPYYGKLKTTPEGAGQHFRKTGKALVDESMMIQYNLEVGDQIKLGQSFFEIEGRLANAFGSSGIGSSFAPSVYIPMDKLDATQLVQPGSLVEYDYYRKLPGNFDIEAWKDKERKSFRDESIRIQTVIDQKENLSEAFSNLNNFLNLVALVSLILGCIGVASSVMIYIKGKIPSIAVLRCLGMKGMQALTTYFLQISILGFLGVVIGAFAGSFIQVMLPIVFKDFLPYSVDMAISWRAIIEGLGIGFLITMLFALIPLIAIRKISPLRTLRSSVDDETLPKDNLKWIIYAAIVLSIFGFLWKLTGSWKEGAISTLGLALAFGILLLFSMLVMWSVRKFFPRRSSFVLRQGLSNLYRPNNQTRPLMISIGLGTAVLTTLFIIQGLILANVSSMDAGSQPNMILFGIEKEQKDSLSLITQSFDMPVIQQVPIITMNLESWKGRTKKDWMADTTRTASRWAINREARVSFRDSLNSDEKLVEGTWVGKVNSGDSIYISLADNYARSMDVTIGDEMVWNVQGARITTYVSSIREINFRSMQTRFFILFPTGVLEQAPQFQVLVTKSPDAGTTARYRSSVVKAFPNVSVVDLGSILVTLNEILTKVSYVIKFMAGFSILTGLIVLLSALMLSKYQRIKESVLLRTIGARQSAILKINATEYALLGMLAAATGIVLSIIASYFLAKYQFELDYHLNWIPVISVFVIVSVITVAIGLINSREVITNSPLEILRKEV